MSLVDADGNEVESWVSTPAKRLPGMGSNAQIVLIPKKPLLPETKYSVTANAVADGKPVKRVWSFTTAADPDTEARVMAKLLADTNTARLQAGLGEVELDSAMSRACAAHARYLQLNRNHPRTQGLGVHDESPSLPGYTPEGKKAGEAAVIAIVSEPRESVVLWLATLYHRVPLLDPSLQRIGYAQAQSGSGEWITVMDVSGR